MLTVYSLDFSDDSISTTTGRPSAWTIRYSAPEVLDSKPRNRASDIFSLGCVLIEMVSGLYGHRLSIAKEHWKRTSNGQSSFARNPEATSSWLALLSDHPISGRLKPIVDFLPTLLATDRLDRPSAQAVVDRLRNLSLLLPDPSHLVNICCGPPPGWIGNLHPERIGGSGLRRMRDLPFWSDIKSYFDTVAGNGMTHVVLDQRYSQVVAKHRYYARKSGLTEPHPYITNVSAIEDACAMLVVNSDKTRSMLDQPRSRPLDTASVMRQILQTYTSCQVLFTALRTKVRIPNAEGFNAPKHARVSSTWQTRTIQISIVGHGRCRDDDRYFSSVFYVLAFKMFDEGYEPSKLGALLVDMSTMTAG